MTDKMQLGKQIEKWGKQFRWIVELGEEMQRIGSIERANSESVTVLGETRRELADLVVERDTAKMDLRDLMEQHQAVQSECKSAVSAAENRAREILANAENNAKAIHEAESVNIAAAEKRINGLKTQISAAEKELKQSRYAAEEEKAQELIKWEDKIDKASIEFHRIMDVIKDTKKKAAEDIKNAAIDSMKNINLD